MQQGFTPAILIHMSAALAALGLGSLVFLRRKGTESHRWMGRTWVGLMLVTALSTWWIRSSGSFSWIHGLSVLTLVMLAFGVRYAIAGSIVRHARVMRGVFYGGLVIAGAFTLLPQRLLGRLVWSTLGLA